MLVYLGGKKKWKEQNVKIKQKKELKWMNKKKLFVVAISKEQLDEK